MQHDMNQTLPFADKMERAMPASPTESHPSRGSLWNARLRSRLLVGGLLIITLLVGLADHTSALAEEPEATAEAAASFSAEDLEHFEKQIRPLLHRRCYECHSAESKVLQGGLRVDSRGHLLAGGDSGPALVPGSLDESLLIEAIRFTGDGYDMPPTGKLPAEEIRLLEDWVARGAAFPTLGAEDPQPQKKVDIEAGRRFWAFQPFTPQQAPELPAETWPRTRIDQFLLAEMQARELTPSPEAEKATLLRRLSFGLIGLPPTPEELAEFLADESPEAYDRQVERLLASPHYGERWGRMWLDLARYSDTTESWLGNTTQAHLYRDWVVQAFNEDIPFDQFTRRQLATDLLEETGLEDLPALGFLGLSPTYFKELLLPPDIIKVIVADEWEERVDAVSRTFLGLTVACARCHDHKFDPITNEDYHALAGVFASTRMTQRPMIPEDRYAPVAAAKEKVAALNEKLVKLRKQKPKPEDEIAELEAEIKEIESTTPEYDTPMAHVIEDQALFVELAGDDPQSGTKLVYRPESQDLNLFIRGNPNRLGPVIPRRFLTVLSPEEPPLFQQGSGRLELADSLIEQSGPLLARVFVNRIWQSHFGRGLVRTPSNFGRLGTPPSHPELLEDLAQRFVEQGWSIKWLQREIVRSAAFRQDSKPIAANESIDPDNIWLWRMSPRRLDVEPWRDAMLAVSGQLDLTLGGPGLPIEDAANRRRTVYAQVHRREVSKELLMHDFPDPGLHSPQRTPTSTPLQGLYALNSPFITAQAQHLAERLHREHPNSFEARIERAYQLLFNRSPQENELALARDFLPIEDTPADSEDSQPTPETPAEAWIQYTHALLASNEFLFLD